MAKAASAVPKGLHTITPQLTLDNANATLDWYKKAFGADEIYRSLGPDGKVMHAEIHIGNSAFFANDVMMGHGPKGYGGSPAGVLALRRRQRRAVQARGRCRREGDRSRSRISSGAIAPGSSPIRPATTGGSQPARKISRRMS